ncbi:putative hemicentin-1-like [Scophthalmus maximus]|uniref:Putative hemicentin-1-like n=1 Tax=Scophthalmus maximus TaxID=52904 RepID=A0A2U9AX78_SCOMX|nr:putative hemicentin-1-like [Scophthalmus maximus]
MKVVTCVCLTEGFPLPTVTWKLLKNVVVHSVVAAPAAVSSNYAVNSTIVLTVSDHRDAALCVSHNAGGVVELKLTIPANESKHEATICCLTRACHRKKKRRSVNLAEDMEMVTVPAIDNGEAVGDDDRTRYQDAAEGGAEAAGMSAPDGYQAPKEVEYSNIVFSALGRSVAESNDAQEATETEYAEIKNEAAQERPDDGGALEEGEEEEAMEEGDERETG